MVTVYIHIQCRYHQRSRTNFIFIIYRILTIYFTIHCIKCVLLKQFPALNSRCLRCNSVDFDFALRHYNIINRYIMFTIVYRYPIRIIMSDAGRCSYWVFGKENNELTNLYKNDTRAYETQFFF